MVGFVAGDPNQGSKLNNSTDQLDPFEKIDDCSLSFADSFLDFENIDKWIEEMSEPDGIVSEKVQFAGAEKCTEMMGEGSCRETTLGDPIADGSEPIVDSSEQILDGSDGCRKLGERDVAFGNLGSLIEEEIGKVSLVGLENDSVHVGGKGMENGDLVDNVDTLKTYLVSIGGESESSSASESSTSSSSSSSGTGDDDSDDDLEEEEEEGGEEEKEVMGEEEKEVMGVEEKEMMGVEEKEMMGVEGEVEEGEIRDDYGHDDDGDDDDDDNEGELETIAGSDYDEEDDGAEDVKGGPIKSKNEIEFLPPIPPLDVTLEPHHQTLPVGAVLSILGAKVIVEGSEKHNPLTEGSILWISESRSLLGLIDEIFGPVRNPYYVVRYNSDSEVPAGIGQGTSISFVQEFAHHILNDSNLYKKGYDASGENDEEVSELEFSDDEKEAEYKRMLKTTKRGTNCQNSGNKKNNRKKGKIRDGPWRNDQHSTGAGQVAPDQDQHHTPQVAASTPFSTGHFFAGGGLVPPPYPQMPQVAGFIPPSSGIWASGIMPCQQQQQLLQSTVFPNGFPTEAMPWPPQNHLPHPFQMPVPNGMLFQQQLDPGHTAFPPNAVFSPGQPNFIMRPSYRPWHGSAAQNDHLNQATFVSGLQGQHARPIVNAGGQGVASSGLPPMGQQPPSATQQFNQRPFFGLGKKPFHRGDGGFGGGGRGGRRGRGRGRGQWQSK